MGANNSKDKEPEPNLGDLIEFQRLGFCHWAVYVGDGEVVHVVPNKNDATTSTIKREKLDDVANGNKWKVNNKQDIIHCPNSPADIVKEANKWVGKTHNYSLWSENCEHFVTSLRNNEPVSKQVRDVALGLALSGLILTGSIIGAIIRIVNGHEKKKRGMKQTKSSSEGFENYTDSDDVVERERGNKEVRENYPDLDDESFYTADTAEDTLFIGGGR